MKKIFFILILAFAVLEAKSCMTDIYFGNGVWNTKKEAISGAIALRKFMLKKATTRLDAQKEGTNFVFKYAYNPSYGTREDLIETFWQLKESGQIGEGYFNAVYAALTWEEATKLYNKLSDVVRNYKSDAATMFTLYQQSSFSQKHNVLLVAHSQGNLFGNKMYTLMSAAQKKKFRMVSVATPADHVAGDGPHITLYGDFVIRPIPNSLPANTNGGGHTFVGAYLGDIDVQIKLSNYIKGAYDNLMQTTSCTTYWALYMHIYADGIMKVYGSPTNTYASELIAEVPMHTYPSKKIIVEDDDGTGTTHTIILCDGDYVPWGLSDLVEYPANYTGEYLRWLPGDIYNKTTVESRKGISLTMLSENLSTCIDIRHDGLLYDVAIGAFE